MFFTWKNENFKANPISFVNFAPLSGLKTHIEVYGAREHNLKDLSLRIPYEQFVVITGLSGSGKSSLAFDTIYAEGQRRYMETFSAYARQFIGSLERPDVDKIDGLSPVIAIEQKTTSKNPRSTVGTVTEIYDFLRLLYARVADAYSYLSGKKMVQYNEDQIIEWIETDYAGEEIVLLAPVVKARKGHYRELFVQIAKKGFVQVWIDGELREIERGMKLDRYKTHDISIVIDRVKVRKGSRRLKQSIETAMHHGENVLQILHKDKLRYFSKNLMCPDTGIAYPDPDPNTFSFNSPKGACPVCKGLGYTYEISDEALIPDENLSIKNGGLAPLGTYKKSWIFSQMEAIAYRYGFTLDTPVKDIPPEAMEVIMHGSEEDFEVKNNTVGIVQIYSIRFEGLKNFIKNQFERNDSARIRRWAKQFMHEKKCTSCGGQRLHKTALHYKLEAKTIGDLAEMEISDLAAWLDALPPKLSERQWKIGEEIIKELRTRVQFLLDVGLDYLSLNRSSGSLSGGESQRIRLATQIGSRLVGVLYILDEPSIGLHSRDNERLIRSLSELRDIGNTVIVVEHDEEMMRHADHIIDMGPGAGIHGGEIVASGGLEDILKSGSLTAQYLTGKRQITMPEERRKGNGKFLVLEGATGNNLKGVNLKIPLGTLTLVTGVSGSGKSSLINETLYPILKKHFYRGVKEPLPYEKIRGIKHIDKVIDIDQSPIGRTPRSNPVTYIGVFSEIRNLFTRVPEAKIRGYKPGRFSFNVKGGRCETCKGAGVRIVEMNFLPDVQVLCETCLGKRFNRETLEIRYKGKSISDVLNMTVEDAVEFFQPVPKIYRKLKTLLDVGLGYISLGQPSTTLSGGEAQRIKLAAELSKKSTGNTLYILDEPTTGLHFEDIKVLMDVLQRLVDKGNTVLIIEHNMDVIKLADYIIDLGPEGGRKGGEIVFAGTPEKLVKVKKNFTGKYLKKHLKHYKNRKYDE